MLMLVKGKIYLIEYNVRFGDPECQPLIFLLKSDLLKILNNCVNKKLNKTKIKWKKEYALSVVMVNKGYPGKFKKYSIIKNLNLTAGNAGNIIILLDGEVRGKAGKVGEVIDSLIIDNNFSN